MAHVHDIVDSDKRFSVNAITRAVKNESTTKVSLIQGDHNSERFTFEVPRYIEGHDMSLATEAQVHYLNVDVPGRYDAKDLRLASDDEEKVVFSWLISRAATQKVGQLAFLVKFRCYDGDEVVYEWNSAPYTGVTVGTGMDNDEELVEIYADVMKAWEAKITEKFVMEDELAEAVDAIEIGVRNLLVYDTVKTSSKHEDFSANAATGVISGTGKYYLMFDAKLEPGAEYTVSVDSVESNGDYGNACSVKLHDTVANVAFKDIGRLSGGNSITFTAPENTDELKAFLVYPTSGTLATYTISNLKLEKGNKATDWTPAPEDMATKSFVHEAIAAALAAAGITN